MTQAGSDNQWRSEPRASARADARRVTTIQSPLIRHTRTDFAVARWMMVMAVVVTNFVTGCGHPKGILFEPIRPPVVWPKAPQVARLSLIGTIANSSDLKPAVSGGEAFRAVLRGRRPPIAFVKPHGVAVHRRGLVAVADTGAAAVHILDLHERTHVRITGWGDERFAAPIGVAWSTDRLYVTDASRHEVVALGFDGRFLAAFGAEVLQRPVGIAWDDGAQELFVVDGQAHVVQVFSRDGDPIRTIGGRGEAPGSFNFPSHIALRGDRILVADSGNFRVQLLDRQGACLRSIGSKGDAAGDFALPKGVAFDSDGHLYVVDAQFENIQIFDDHGRLLLAVGREGRGPGEFWLPAGIAIDDQDRVWVADGGNRRIQVFQYIKERSQPADAAAMGRNQPGNGDAS